MTIAAPALELIASSTIDVTAGRTVSLAAAYKDPIDNANAANGFIKADADGKVYGRFFASSGTAATINGQVPAAGELVWKTDILQAVMGNNALAGGLPLNLNGQDCIFLAGDGTAVKNGQALSDALTLAAARTPYGAALSATNLFTVALGPGQYDLRSLAGHLAQPNYVRIVGLAGSLLTTIITDSTHRLTITQTLDGGSLRIAFYSHLKGLTFSSPSGSASLTITFAQDGAATAGPIYLNHEDLDFAGLSSTTSAMTFGTLTATHTPVLDGYVRNVRTTGRALYGGFATTPYLSSTFTTNVRFENCRGGNRSYGASGSAIGTRDGLLSGTLAGLYNCQNFGSGTAEFSAKIDCPMIGCDWQPPIQSLGSNAYIAGGRIGETNGTNSIYHGSAVTARIAHMRLAGTIHANVTNSLSGTVDGAGNFVDAQA